MKFESIHVMSMCSSFWALTNYKSNIFLHTENLCLTIYSTFHTNPRNVPSDSNYNIIWLDSLSLLNLKSLILIFSTDITFCLLSFLFYICVCLKILEKSRFHSVLYISMYYLTVCTDFDVCVTDDHESRLMRG